MAERVHVEDLVGPAEIAERLGLSNANTVNLWRRRHPDFPEPIKVLRGGALWSWPAVAEWARRTKRLGDD